MLINLPFALPVAAQAAPSPLPLLLAPAAIRNTQMRPLTEMRFEI